jgi:hypothetical protein
MVRRRWLPFAAWFVLIASAGTAQQSAPTPAQAAPFLGTWVIDMTEPAAFTGTHTVRIWDNNGVVAASIQVEQFPPNPVTGILRDGNMLVLTINREAPSPMLENGAPISSVLALTLEADIVRAAYLLERSRDVKRGIGKKQVN